MKPKDPEREIVVEPLTEPVPPVPPKEDPAEPQEPRKPERKPEPEKVPA